MRSERVPDSARGPHATDLTKKGTYTIHIITCVQMTSQMARSLRHLPDTTRLHVYTQPQPELRSDANKLAQLLVSAVTKWCPMQWASVVYTAK